MTAMEKRHPTVIGIGNPDCGDDAAGREVARRLSARLGHGLRIKEASGEPIELMAAMKGHEAVILVDAIAPVSAPGTLHIIDASSAPPPAEFFGHLSTHGFGLVESIELARALGELPPRLLVVGIEGKSFEPGDAMTPVVSTAVKEAEDWIIEKADAYCGPRKASDLKK